VTPEWQRKDLTLCGIRVSILDRPAATSEKPAILLLHGLVAEGATFRKLIEALPPDRRLIAVDLPGAGYSERPLHADVSFAGMANVIQAAISTLGLHQPILLGHSHGGAVALRLAATHHALLSGLILLCPAHPFSRYEYKLVRFYLSSAGRLFARCLPLIPRPIMLFIFKNMPGGVSRASFNFDDLEPYLHTLRAPGTVPHLLRLLSTWQSDMYLLGGDLQSTPLTTPTLLLWGTRDLIVPLKTASRLAGHIARAKLIPLPGAGHLPNEEYPQECAAAITTWLAEAELHRLTVHGENHRKSPSVRP